MTNIAKNLIQPFNLSIGCLLVYFFVPNSFFGGIAEPVFFMILLALRVLFKKQEACSQSRGIPQYLFWPLLMLCTFLLNTLFSNIFNLSGDLSERFIWVIPVKIISFMMMGAVILTTITSKEDFVKFLKCFCFLGFVSSVLIGLGQFIAGKRLLYSAIFFGFYGDVPFSRLTTFKIDDPNWAILDLFPLSVMFFFFLFSRYGRKQYVWIIGFSLSLLAVFCTFSRTGWISLALMLCYLIFHLKATRQKAFLSVKYILIGLLFGGVFFSLLAQFIDMKIPSSLYDFLNIDRLRSFYNFQLRWELWDSTVKELSVKPINLLFGLSGVNIPAMLYKRIGLQISNHSFYLTVLFKYGIFGLLLTLIFCIHILKTLKNIAWYSKGDPFYYDFAVVLLVGFLGYLLLIFFISECYDFYIFFYWVMTIKLRQLLRDEKYNKEIS